MTSHPYITIKHDTLVISYARINFKSSTWTTLHSGFFTKTHHFRDTAFLNPRTACQCGDPASINALETQHFRDLAVRLPGETKLQRSRIERSSNLASVLSDTVAQWDIWVGWDSGFLWKHNTSIMLPSEWPANSTSGTWICLLRIQCDRWYASLTVESTMWCLKSRCGCSKSSLTIGSKNWLFQISYAYRKVNFEFADYWDANLTDENPVWLVWSFFDSPKSRLAVDTHIFSEHALTDCRIAWVSRYESASLNTHLLAKTPIMNIELWWGASTLVVDWHMLPIKMLLCQPASMIVARLVWCLSIQCNCSVFSFQLDWWQSLWALPGERDSCK